MDKMTYDFAGWATRNDIKCSDGRTIRNGAFKHCDGQTVPLVWNHDHKDIFRVLGKAVLQNRKEGVYAYCSFNDTEEGKTAKELVKHGDIQSLSIYANQLKQNGGDVIHGTIREVSLVLAGANPGAYIETVMAHSDTNDEEARIYNQSETFELDGEVNVDELKHTEEVENKETEVKHADTKVEETNQNKNEKMEDTKQMPENKEKTVQDVLDEMTEEQKNVVYALVAMALEDKENNKEENTEMKQNAFEGRYDVQDDENVLSHSELMEIVSDAKKIGSMREAFLQHSITDVGNLFPEYQTVTKTPELVKRDDSWVKKVMNSVHHTPFSKVKSTYANITGEQARAKGYVKGHQKVEEVISAFKRKTDPTTVYKLQKMDRDDVIDITDFDVIAWLKLEMRDMLDEELARAILIGDGRGDDDNDKINPLNIRPILGDNSVYTVPKIFEKAEGATDAEFYKEFIRIVIKSRKDYKGSGNPTFYTTEDVLTNLLLLEDTNGRVIYDTEEKLRTALRVKDIVTVEVMENCVRTNQEETFDFKCFGIIVNLADYNVGADKGGQVNMFDDFDINYNKYEYLIETRCSGALVKPYSAISFEYKYPHTA